MTVGFRIHDWRSIDPFQKMQKWNNSKRSGWSPTSWVAGLGEAKDIIIVLWASSSVLLPFTRGFPGGSVVKNPPANAGDTGSIPGSGRSPGEGNGNPLQYSCLEIPWTEEPGGLLSMGSQRVRYYWAHTHRQIYTVKVTKLPCVKLIGRLKDNSSKIICISSKNTQTKMKYDVKISKCGGGRGE